MSLINTLLTELETRHTQKGPASPRPVELQNLQPVPPKDNEHRTRRLLLMLMALFSALAAAWVVFNPDFGLNGLPWESRPVHEVQREENTDAPTVHLLSPPLVSQPADESGGFADPTAAMMTDPLAEPEPPQSQIGSVESMPQSPAPTSLASASAMQPQTDNALTKSPPKSSAVHEIPLTKKKPATKPRTPEKIETLTAPAKIAPQPPTPAVTEFNSKSIPIAAEQASSHTAPPTPIEKPSVPAPPAAPKPLTALKSSSDPPVPVVVSDAIVQQRYQHAKLSLKKGFLSEAEQQLLEVLALAPGHVAARGSLAGLMIDQGRWMESEHLLNEGLKIDPNEISLITWQARILIEQGAEKQALQMLEQAPDKAQKDPDFCGFLATLYNRANNDEKALPLYRKALGMRPTEGRWWIGLASIYERKQNYKAAVDAYSRSIADSQLDRNLIDFARRRIDNLRNR